MISRSCTKSDPSFRGLARLIHSHFPGLPLLQPQEFRGHIAHKLASYRSYAYADNLPFSTSRFDLCGQLRTLTLLTRKTRRSRTSKHSSWHSRPKLTRQHGNTERLVAPRVLGCSRAYGPPDSVAEWLRRPTKGGEFWQESHDSVLFVYMRRKCSYRSSSNDPACSLNASTQMLTSKLLVGLDFAICMMANGI